MGNQPNVDEGIVMDFTGFRRNLVKHLSRDGDYCERDARIVQLFDGSHRELSRVTRARMALETTVRCGITKHSRAIVRDARIAFVEAGGQVTNVVQLPLRTENARAGDDGPSVA